MRLSEQWDKSDRVCKDPECGLLFEPARRCQIYCDKSCKDNCNNKKRHSSHVDYTPIVCANPICILKTFKPIRLKQQYCSTKCGDIHRNELRKQVRATRDTSPRSSTKKSVIGDSEMAMMLNKFCNTIDSYGGCFISTDGNILPLFDPSAISLGEIYNDACNLLGRVKSLRTDPRELHDCIACAHPCINTYMVSCSHEAYLCKECVSNSDNIKCEACNEGNSDV